MTTAKPARMRLAARGSDNSVTLRVQAPVRALMPTNLGRRLLRRCLRMMDAVGICQTELSLLFTNDEELALANRGWLERRGPTDIISFPAAQTRHDLRHWQAPPRRAALSPERLFGDLLVSLETIRRRSPKPAEYERDLTELLAHGFGHLLHFDHHGDAARRRQWKEVQADLLATATARTAVTRIDALDRP